MKRCSLYHGTVTTHADRRGYRRCHGKPAQHNIALLHGSTLVVEWLCDECDGEVWPQLKELGWYKPSQ